MQKVMFKGLLPEEKTLREIKVTKGAKIMVVGSTINDVLAVNTPKEAAQQEVKAEENKKEPLCRQKVVDDSNTVIYVLLLYYSAVTFGSCSSSEQVGFIFLQLSGRGVLCRVPAAERR